MRIALLIPSYNQTPWGPEFHQKMKRCCLHLEQLQLDPTLVFVDDGSTAEDTDLDCHRANLQSIDHCKVIGIKHDVNRGQGAALMTALEVARSKVVGANLFVTMDSDGQHDPADIFSLLARFKEKNLNIIFGNRFAGNPEILHQMPFKRRLILRVAGLFERILTGLKLTDAHNGFRLFDLKTANALNIRQDRMAHATEIKLCVAENKFKYGEAPVNIQYTLATLRNGQQNSNAFNILRDLFQGWLFE